MKINVRKAGAMAGALLATTSFASSAQAQQRSKPSAAAAAAAPIQHTHDWAESIFANVDPYESLLPTYRVNGVSEERFRADAAAAGVYEVMRQYGLLNGKLEEKLKAIAVEFRKQKCSGIMIFNIDARNVDEENAPIQVALRTSMLGWKVQQGNMNFFPGNHNESQLLFLVRLQTKSDRTVSGQSYKAMMNGIFPAYISIGRNGGVVNRTKFDDMRARIMTSLISNEITIEGLKNSQFSIPGQQSIDNMYDIPDMLGKFEIALPALAKGILESKRYRYNLEVVRVQRMITGDAELPSAVSTFEPFLPSARTFQRRFEIRIPRDVFIDMDKIVNPPRVRPRPRNAATLGF